MSNLYAQSLSDVVTCAELDTFTEWFDRPLPKISRVGGYENAQIWRGFQPWSPSHSRHLFQSESFSFWGIK